MVRHGEAVLAADVGGTWARAALVDRTGEVVAGPWATASQALSPAQWVREVVRRLGSAHPAAAGVSVAAAVDPLGRRVGFAPHLPHWQGQPLATYLEEELGACVRLVNDGHAALWGERWRGAARGVDHVAMVVLGTGVGGAALAGGRLVTGAHGLAGVAGLVPVRSEEAVRPLEEAVSGPALARRASRALGHPCGPAELLAAAQNGVPNAVNLLAQVVEELGQGLAAWASLLDPQVILLGGGLGMALAPYVPQVEQALRHWAHPAYRGELRVTPAALGDQASLLGAAWVAWRAFLGVRWRGR